MINFPSINKSIILVGALLILFPLIAVLLHPINYEGFTSAHLTEELEPVNTTNTAYNYFLGESNDGKIVLLIPDYWGGELVDPPTDIKFKGNKMTPEVYYPSHHDFFVENQYYVSNFKLGNSLYSYYGTNYLKRIYSPELVGVAPIVLLLCPVSGDDCSLSDKFYTFIVTAATILSAIFIYKNKKDWKKILFTILSLYLLIEITNFLLIVT